MTKQTNPWVEFLAEIGFCTPNYLTENMPCDDGAVCDRCSADWVQEDYQAWLEKRKKS